MGVSRAQRNIRWIEGHCRVPEGSLVGQPVRLRPWQKKIIRGVYDGRTRRAIVSFGRKNGKGLALDTPIPTPSGWTTMGQLQAGDEVFGANGKPTRVEFVSPIHVGLRCWRLTFSDGSTIVADEQHRWLTRHSFRPWAKARRNGSGNGGRWREEVVTTPQIAESVYRARRDGGKEHNHKIRLAPATESADVALPVDPYALGAWLGDGTSAGGTFTCGEADVSEMADMLSAGLGGVVSVARYGGRAPTIRTPGLGFQAALRRVGALGNKHIPDVYFSAGTAQRWALLQGLMDTDGTVNSHAGQTTARASFAGTNEALCWGVWRLARSLGLKATFREGEAKFDGRVIGKAYAVAFPATKGQSVFRLQRKQSLLSATLGRRSGTVAIVACEEVESVPTVCIKVAAKDSLFLAGHGCIPTHNTALSAFLLLLHLCGPEHRRSSQLVSAAQSRDQAALLFNLAAKSARLSETLAPVLNIRDTRKEIECPELGTLYRALSADASNNLGLSPVFAVHDELGEVRGPRSDLYTAVEFASGAHESPLSIVISTQAPTDADLLSVLIDRARLDESGRTKLFLYTAPDGMDPFSDKALKAANPAFGDFQNAKETRGSAADAKETAALENEFRNKVLNQRVTTASPFIAKGIWNDNGAAPNPDFSGRDVYGGLDLAQRGDTSALVWAADDDDFVDLLPRVWIPEQGIVERSRQDRKPYDLWARDGHLLTTPGPTVSYRMIAEEIMRARREWSVRSIAYDPNMAEALWPWLQELGLSEEERESLFHKVQQGYAGMSPCIGEFQSLLLERRIRHGNHPVLTAHCVNAVLHRGSVSDQFLLKKPFATERIDSAVGASMALGRRAMMLAEVETILSPWEDPNAVVQVL